METCRSKLNCILTISLIALVTGVTAMAASPPSGLVAEALATPLAYLQGKAENFLLTLDYEEKEEGQWKSEFRLNLIDIPGQATFIEATLDQSEAIVRQTPGRLDLLLPEKRHLFRGEGIVAPENQFQVSQLLVDVLSLDSTVRSVLSVIRFTPDRALIPIISNLLPADWVYIPTDDGWHIHTGDPAKPSTTLLVTENGKGIVEARFGKEGNQRLRISMKHDVDPLSLPRHDVTDWEVEAVDRNEQERTLSRGLFRMAEIQYEDSEYPRPADGVQSVAHGKLIVENGNRLLLLAGTPQEIGLAQGKLLRREIRKVVDSTLYTVGLVYSLQSGKWFPGEITRAWESFSPYVSEDYLIEMKAIAEGSGIEFEEIKRANFFPELFHCSGFAIRGEATVDGKLFHGRVLDYMTEIGLQYYAVVKVVSQPGKHAFANIGYAGFTGSVSGMNEKGISIGEMGGGGVGQWDGRPMAQLVREALEHASDLKEAKQIFSEGKRTCEYYYVIADGPNRDAVGVYALPEQIDFLGFGEAHPLLPEPVEDAVLLSAGDRYTTLVQRVRENFGKIDTEQAIGLMDIGVAMRKSNLHNVLFIPEDLVFYVANASNNDIAARMPYVRYDLKKILEDMKSDTTIFSAN